MNDNSGKKILVAILGVLLLIIGMSLSCNGGGKLVCTNIYSRVVHELKMILILTEKRLFMKRLQGVLFLFVSTIMICIGISVVTAQAAEKGKCGDNVYWEFNDGVLCLTGKGSMDNMDYYDQPWNEYKEEIKKVIVSNGITSIGNNSFAGFYNIKSVVLPQSVTEIGSNAFSGTSIKKIKLSKKTEYIGEEAFSYCTKLKKVLNINCVEYIYKAAFQGCKKLKSIKLGDRLISIGEYSFSGSGLKEIVLPDSLEVMGERCFAQCSSLESAVLPVKITNIPFYAFYDCGRLKKVVFRGSIAVIAERAFWECGSLESVEIPAGASQLVIGPSAFACCKSLRTLTSYAYSWYAYDDAFYDATRVVMQGPKESKMEELAKYFNVPYKSVKMKVGKPDIKKTVVKQRTIRIDLASKAPCISYEVAYSKNKDMSNAKTEKTLNNESVISVKKLSAGQYYYRVRKCYKCNGKEFYSDWTDIGVAIIE